MNRNSMEVSSEVVPAFWLPALINGDPLPDATEEEEKELEAFIDYTVKDGWHITAPMTSDSFVGASIWAKLAGDMEVIGLVRPLSK